MTTMLHCLSLLLTAKAKMGLLGGKVSPKNRHPQTRIINDFSKRCYSPQSVVYEEHR
ncbi:hypothetical protein ANN_22614 [Periplaneta americana]|uniref:Uncharacterized protein n=1 Tax=Periplaneta americana TaxID=6978 RepID=A0ABQ8S8W0_PERAM|nr:hypothetical protein ANN_22614 [Periplaneta americana]